MKRQRGKAKKKETDLRPFYWIGAGVAAVIILPMVVSIVVAVVSALIPVAIGIALVATAVSVGWIDPILIAVTEENYWVEVCRWNS